MPPKLRGDLVFAKRLDGTWNVFDPLHARHFRIGQQERDWLFSLDGQADAEEIQRIVPRENFAQFSRLVTSYGLLVGSSVKKKNLIRRKYYLLLSRPSLLCEMPETTARVIRDGLFACSAISLVLVLFIVLLSGQLTHLQRQVLYHAPQVGILEIAKIMCALLLVSAVHESSHVIVARSYGVFVSRVGLMLLGFQPLFFADVSAMRNGTTPLQRLSILMAGIAANVVLAVLFMICAGIVGLHSTFVYYVAGISLTSATFNLIPFFEYDGYHVLADCLQMPNLSRQAASAFKMGHRAKEATVRVYLIGALAFRWGLSWAATNTLVFTGFSVAVSWFSLGYVVLLSACVFGILTALWVREMP